MGNFLKGIGIEDEFFVHEINPKGNLDGGPQRELLKKFSKAYSFRIAEVHVKDGLPTQINKDVLGGYFCIKFDSTYQIIEVAYPPCTDAAIALELVSQMRHQFDAFAKGLGFNVIHTGFIERDLNPNDFVKKETVQKTNARQPSGMPFFDRFYHGKICSTQIHLSMESNDIFSLLPKLYRLEPLIPIFFSNSIVPNVANCFRLLLLQDGFEKNYNLFGFPESIPKSKEEYSSLQSSSSGFYRDYSLIVPRPFGTWEFRSACGQNSLVDLKYLIEFRLAVLKFVSSRDWIFPEYSLMEMKAVFRDACLNPSSPNVQKYLQSINELGVFERIVNFSSPLENLFFHGNQFKGAV